MTSAKSQFLQKLQAHRAAPRPFDNRVQADIATFSQRISALQVSMEAWLEGTGIETEATAETLTDLLAGQASFPVPGIRLRYEERSINITPLFLYGHGVTGCLAVSLRADGRRTPLGRLLMRPDRVCARPALPSAPETDLNEETFFTLLAPLLPE
ncbi:hypothetical protein QEG60_004661 [Pluralibacter gergoviae]|uniref:hypothetical protein n=1 Tax=Pluralibacter gergoviae TaxID=61647 RepID=UPI000A388015|nr:hypothetical protein [Pluralibacter gergoviae]EKT9642866.1 hypothetical protein [Pluralibacter gergoviae]EKV3545893.1 hypothetical protein [Pluralibacter gergoviae]EKV9901220.1 hypothetical protein [Pluralibacter gergoviae]EKV9932875.1 hypothetical protein [Pluralibacter gergoviae]ELC3073005.1 hypothetical protein [Pluralibacter gergoviae]